MELREYMSLLAKRWRLVVAIVLVTMGLFAGVTIVMKPTYEAETQLFVSVPSGPSEPAQLYEGSSFSQERVKSYASLATTPEVTRPVIEELGLDVTPRQLAERISAEAPVETVLIDLAVSDNSPRRAAVTANAVAEQLAAFIRKVESPADKTASPVKVSVVMEAQPPLQPVSPRPLINLALGLLLGMGIAAGSAVLRESFDVNVNNAGDLEEATGLPVLATIPHDAQGGETPIVRGDPHGKRSEAFRHLRTNLQYADVDESPRIILVTSALESEGKSSVAGNLAIALAQASLRVCLVDGDLRRPSVADYFGVVGEVGLTTVLSGRASISEVIQPAVAGVDVIASGEIPPNPSELLGSQRMDRILQELSTSYDKILIDAPPVLPVTDAVVLASEARAALVVVRAGKTASAQTVQAVTSLRNVGARVLGGVVNMAPATGRDAHRYGYGHSYAPSTGDPSAGRRKPTPQAGSSAGRLSLPSVRTLWRPAGAEGGAQRRDGQPNAQPSPPMDDVEHERVEVSSRSRS